MVVTVRQPTWFMLSYNNFHMESTPEYQFVCTFRPQAIHIHRPPFMGNSLSLSYVLFNGIQCHIASHHKDTCPKIGYVSCSKHTFEFILFRPMILFFCTHSLSKQQYGPTSNSTWPPLDASFLQDMSSGKTVSFWNYTKRYAYFLDVIYMLESSLETNQQPIP